MPRGDKSKYTSKQKRQAEHIEEGYKRRGVSENEAESRAWATVNKIYGGGEKGGSGQFTPDNPEPYYKGGRKGGRAAAARPRAARSASAKRAARTRQRRAAASPARRTASAKRATASRASGRRPGARKRTAARR